MLRLGGPEIRIVLCRVDGVVRFTDQFEHPFLQPGWTAASPERVDQRGRPQVLMDVDFHG